jgi:hypothetical protein
VAGEKEGALRGGGASCRGNDGRPEKNYGQRREDLPRVRISPDKFKEKFSVGDPLDATETFQSTSTNADTAWEFSLGDHNTPRDQTVAVVLEAQLFDGRDIKELSVVKKEDEILTLPGTAYKVESIEDMPSHWQRNRPTGAPPATVWKMVKATQFFK